MMNLPLNALRAFAFVYQANGIRPAARQMGISHSAVARHVRELEGWLGVELLDAREGQRRLSFTANGKMLGETALFQLQALEARASSIRESRQKNSVVVSTTASIAARLLLPRLSDLHRQLPEIELSVLTEQLVIDPDGIQTDISIRMGQGPWPGCQCQPLMNDALYPAVHPSLMKGSRRTPNSLFGKYPLIHDRDPDTAWSTWLAAYPVAGLDIRKGPRHSSSDLVIRAAKEGLGIALVRDRLAADEIGTGALTRPFGEQKISIEKAYWVVTQPGEVRQAVALVVEWLTEQT